MKYEILWRVNRKETETLDSKNITFNRINQLKDIYDKENGNVNASWWSEMASLCTTMAVHTAVLEKLEEVEHLVTKDIKGEL